MDRNGLTIADTAIEAARGLGLGGDVASRLLRMARGSSICTHSRGNRRFEDYVLFVDDHGVVQDVHYIDDEDEDYLN